MTPGAPPPYTGVGAGTRRAGDAGEGLPMKRARWGWAGAALAVAMAMLARGPARADGEGAADAHAAAEVESEIRDRMLSGAAGNVHLLAAPPERFAVWKALAEAGDPAAQWLLGRSYDLGFAVAKDPAQAVAWHRKAADRGYPRAQLSLGLMLAAGRGAPKDLEAAFRLYEKAAEQPTCPEAYEWLIQAYNRGYGVAKDPTRARELGAKAVAAYGQMADRGYAGARMRLARILTTGTWGSPIDLPRGLELYRTGAEQGHVYCLTNLGDAYARGQLGLPRDPARAADLFRRAAALGEPIAVRSLAEMYLDGEVPRPDPVEADRIYAAALPALRADAAAMPPDAPALFRLAQMVERGAGLPRDDAEAVALLRRAAEAGSAPAALALADCLDAGRGVEKDTAEAARLRESVRGRKSP